jgi:hypothetical protein
MGKFYGIDSIVGNGTNYYNEDGELVGYTIDSIFGCG